MQQEGTAFETIAAHPASPCRNARMAIAFATRPATTISPASRTAFVPAAACRHYSPAAQPTRQNRRHVDRPGTGSGAQRHARTRHRHLTSTGGRARLTPRRRRPGHGRPAGGTELPSSTHERTGGGGRTSKESAVRSCTGPRYEDLELEVSATIGVAVAAGQNGRDASTLSRRADVAMYEAKKHGNGGCAYGRELDENRPRKLALVGDCARD